MCQVLFQPSFTSLAPGYGVRRVNMLDRRVESFVSLHKEPIRDLSFNPIFQVFDQICISLLTHDLKWARWTTFPWRQLNNCRQWWSRFESKALTRHCLAGLNLNRVNWEAAT